MKQITGIFILLAFFHCNNPHKHGMSNGHANKHMHSHKFEELVKRFESPGRDKWQKPDRVIAAMGSLKGKTIAEIGSGTGYFTFRLAQTADRVIAADVDERFLDYIKNKKQQYPKLAGKIETLKIPYSSPDLPENKFDKVLIVNTYHHINDRVKYFTVLNKKMGKGAELYIVDFKKGTPVGPPDHIKLTAEQITNELRKAGFASVSTDSKTLDYQYIIKALK